MRLLVIAEHDNTQLNPATHRVVSAAARIGGEIHLLVAGSNCATVARAAARISGVSRVFLADAPVYADQTPESLAALVVRTITGYSHVLAPATTTCKSFMPRVAALLDVAQISEIIAIDSPDTFVRPIFAGNVLATVQSVDAVKVITVRTTAFDVAGEEGTASVERIPDAPAPCRSRLIARELNVSDWADLASASVVVSGGRGLSSADDFHAVLEPLADQLGAALGATRAAVDAGYISNDHQVGQTGKIVAPRLYIAVGLSGAIQHLAGMRESGVIVAINKDAEAPIFQAADYGFVADLFEAVPALLLALQKAGEGGD